MEINVVYQFNERYVPYAGVSMTSLFINNANSDDINVYVLGENLSESSMTLLRMTAEKYGRSVSFPETGALLKQFEADDMIPYRGAYSVYLRLFFSQMIDLRGKKVLYLDADTIVNGNLQSLFDYDLGGKSIGMVLESIRDDYKVMIGMGKDSDYYNSGVILFDVDKWIANRYCERLVEHIQNVRSSYIGDQDFLNIVCEGDVCRLPLIYNFQPLHARYSAKEYFKAYPVKTTTSGVNSLDTGKYYSSEEIESGKSTAVIYHCYRWLGEFPWDKDNLHPFNDLFDMYLERSLWDAYEKKQANIGIVLKLEEMLYRILPKGAFILVFKKAHEMMLKRAERKAKQKKVSQSA